MTHEDNNVFNFTFGKKKWIKRIKYAFQRAKCGYCDYDLYDFDHFLSHILSAGLEELSKKANGYPDGKTAEEWTEELKEISDACYQMFHCEKVGNEVDEILDDLILVRQTGNQKAIKEVEEELRSSIGEFEEEKEVLVEVVFDWFKENYYNLWD